jgi:hypothetical protein
MQSFQTFHSHAGIAFGAGAISALSGALWHVPWAFAHEAQKASSTERLGADGAGRRHPSPNIADRLNSTSFNPGAKNKCSRAPAGECAGTAI